MRKELLLAIIIGVIIGLSVAFGVWRANSAIKNETTKVNEQSQTQNNTQDDFNTQELKITVAQPEDDDVFTETPITVTGITKPDTLVVISSEDNDMVVSSDNDGGFKADIELVAGINNIKFVAFSNSGDKTEMDKTIVFSSEFAKQ